MSRQESAGLEALHAFQQLDLDRHLSCPDPDPWPSLRTLTEVAATVPAYIDYLNAREVDLKQVDSLEAFQRLPLMTKADYLGPYPLARRVVGGDLAALDRLAVSSGSTGTPTFWPRAERHEFTIARRFEQVFRDAFKAHQRKTLCVIAFALGNWVGGLFTTSCCWHLARKGYPLTVATPGNRLDEILRVIDALGGAYEQVVLLGYPPFVRDVIEAGLKAGLDWSALRTRLVFAGEVFSEEWRAALVEKIGAGAAALATASLYGTADGGVLGNETPLSIEIRRLLAQRPDLARALFGASRLPTLVQYDPRDRYFEVVEGTLVVSGDNGVPLLRYHIKDEGGVISYAAMWAFLEAAGVADALRAALPKETPIRPLPFVFVFGRADFTVSYYGANVFPENVTVGLETPALQDQLTGKFVMESLKDPNGAPSLHLVVELQKDVRPSEALAEQVAQSVEAALHRLNSEFSNYVPAAAQRPRVVLKPFQDPEDFPAGVKHRYTRKGLRA